VRRPSVNNAMPDRHQPVQIERIDPIGVRTTDGSTVDAARWFVLFK